MNEYYVLELRKERERDLDETLTLVVSRCRAATANGSKCFAKEKVNENPFQFIKD
jgi:hypothetical protein